MFVQLFFSTILFSTAEIQLVQDATDDMVRDVTALELFLSDKENHKKYCSDILWKQPNISVYKEKLETQLPSTCISRLPKEE